MNTLFLLHIHLLLCRRNSPLRSCPNNCLSLSYSTVFHSAANTLDMHVMCIDSPYHCDAIALLVDVGEPELVPAHVLLVSHHNCLTSTSLSPFANTNPGSLLHRATLVSLVYT